MRIEEKSDMKDVNQEYLLDMNFLKKVLVGSAVEGKVPTDSILILSEVSNGVLDFLGGKIDPYNGENYNDFRHQNWERVQDFFKYETGLSSRLSDSFLRMVEVQGSREGHEWVTYTELEEYYCGNWGCGLRPAGYPQKTVPTNLFIRPRRIEFSENEEADLTGIIEYTKPIVERDVKYLTENSW